MKSRILTTAGVLGMAVAMPLSVTASQQFKQVRIVNVSGEVVTAMFQLQPGCGGAARGYTYVCHEMEVMPGKWKIYKPGSGIDVARAAETVGLIGAGAVVGLAAAAINPAIGPVVGSVAFTAADKGLHDLVEASTGLPKDVMKVTFFHHNKAEQKNLAIMTRDRARAIKAHDKYYKQINDAYFTARKKSESLTKKMWKEPILTPKRAEYEKRANHQKRLMDAIGKAGRGHVKQAEKEFPDLAAHDKVFRDVVVWATRMHAGTRRAAREGRKIAALREHLGKSSKRSECLVPNGSPVIYVDHFRGAPKTAYFSCSTVPPRTFFAGWLVGGKRKSGECFVYHGHKHKKAGFRVEPCRKTSKSQQWWYNRDYRTLTNAHHYDRCLGATKSGKLTFGKCGRGFKPTSDRQRWIFAADGRLINAGFLNNHGARAKRVVGAQCLTRSKGRAVLATCDLGARKPKSAQRWRPGGGSVADMAKNSKAGNLAFHHNRYFTSDIDVTNATGEKLSVFARYRPGCGGIEAEHSYLCEKFGLSAKGKKTGHTVRTPEAGFIAAEYVRDLALAGIFSKEKEATSAGIAVAEYAIGSTVSAMTGRKLMENKALLPEKTLAFYIYPTDRIGDPRHGTVCVVDPSKSPLVRIRKATSVERRNKKAPAFVCRQG